MASTIILSDNGASSGSAGVKTTGGNDGVLILQTTTSGGTALNALYIDNSQNVGVYVTPSTWYSYMKAVQVSNTNSYVASYTTQATSYQHLFIGNNGYMDAAGTWTYSRSRPVAQYYQQDDTHTWKTAASGTAGNPISFVQTLSVGRTTTLALEGATSNAGTGITFPATQSASTDANTLDDYEEGTWTPTLGDSSGSDPTSVSYLVQEGTYYKIGKMVTVTGRFAYNTYTGGSARIVIRGLPFTSANNSRQNWGAMMTEAVALGSGKSYAQCVVGPNETFITPITGGSSANYDSLVLTTATPSNSTWKFFTFGITYSASA